MTNRDEANFVRPKHLPGVELVEVVYSQRAFPDHSHSEYVVGAIIDGTQVLETRDQEYSMPAGSLVLLNPDQVHSNRKVGDEALRYKVLYIPGHFGGVGLPRCETEERLTFLSPVLNQRRVFENVVYTFDLLAQCHDDPLEQQNSLAELLLELESHSSATQQSVDRSSGGLVDQMKAFIDENYRSNFGLQDLAALTERSICHCSRMFAKETGLSPVAYRNQKRVFVARQLLLRGASIADVALEVGFADQSHLTRQFQNIIGTSPGRYLSSIGKFTKS